MILNALLWDIELEMNLGFAIRDAYTLGNGLLKLKIFDPKKIIQTKRDTITLYSSYAIDHYHDIEVYHTVTKVLNYLDNYKGRIICMSPNEKNTNEISEFQFSDRDLIIFGNEYAGLPDEIYKYADANVVIPMYGSVYSRPSPEGKVTKVGQQRCLGFHSSFAISLFLAIHQLTKHENWQSSFQHPLLF